MSCSTDSLFGDEIAVGSKKKRHHKVTFKPYEVNQSFLFPKSTDDYLAKDHIARLLSSIIDRIDIPLIYQYYRGGGASAYDPRMLLKVWLLGFTYRIYSCRALAKAIKENVAFIWISGNQQPDFRTLNNFRLVLGKEMRDVFKQVVQLALDMGIIKGEDIFIDHTKIEANASRFKMFWGKIVNKRLDQIDCELEKLFSYVGRIEKRENKIYGKKGYSENGTARQFTNEDIEEMIGDINAGLKKKAVNPGKARFRKRKFRRMRDLISRKSKYLLQKSILGLRNSYSRTDPDAVAMRQKDHVTTKPSYNEGVATENRFVIDYDVSQSPSDSTRLRPLVLGSEEMLDKTMETVTADGGYGSEENFTFLEEKNIEGFVKYYAYYKENRKKWRQEKIRPQDFLYEAEFDRYRCPNGQYLNFRKIMHRKSKTGFVETTHVYSASCDVCGRCRFKAQCTPHFRSLHVNKNFESHKRKARARLKSPKGRRLSKMRWHNVETVFADRKHNYGKRRYHLRGLDKVRLEAGLFYASYNIRFIHSFVLQKIKQGWSLQRLLMA